MQASLWASQFYCWTKFFRILYRYDFRFFLRYSNEGKCSLNGHFKNNTCVKRKKSKEMKNCKIKFCRLFFFVNCIFLIFYGCHGSVAKFLKTFDGNFLSYRQRFEFWELLEKLLGQSGSSKYQLEQNIHLSACLWTHISSLNHCASFFFDMNLHSLRVSCFPVGQFSSKSKMLWRDWMTLKY